MWNRDNIFSTLLPIWTMSQIFGLCNQSLYDSVSKERLSRCKWFIKYVYNIVILALLTYLIIVNLQFSINKNIYIVTQFADILDSITNTLAMSVSILFSLYYQNKLLVIIKEINGLDELLRQCPTWRTYRNSKILLATYMSTLVMGWIIFFWYYVFIQCNNTTNDLMPCLRVWYERYIGTKISEIFLMQYTLYLFIVMEKLKVFNNWILVLANGDNNAVNGTNSLKNNDIDLDLLEKIYTNLLKIFEKLHTVYTFPMLIKITNLFVIIFTVTYLTIFGYTAFDEFVKPSTLGEFLVPLTYLLIPTYQLLMVTIISELLTSESRTTGKLIYRIPISRNNVMLMKRVSLIL